MAELKSVRIGGMDFNVEYFDEVDPNDLNKLGMYMDTTQNIFLKRGMAKSQHDETLLHELLHGVVSMMGLWEEIDESKVERLSRGLYMLMMDNKKVFEKFLS